MEFFLAHPALLTYIFLKLHTLNAILECSSFILGAISGTGLLIYRMDVKGDKYEEENNFFTYTNLRTLIISTCVVWFLTFTLPSQKDAAIILGAVATTEAYKAVSNSEIANKGLQVLELKVNEILQNTIDEVAEKAKKKAK